MKHVSLSGWKWKGACAIIHVPKKPPPLGDHLEARGQDEEVGDPSHPLHLRSSPGGPDGAGKSTAQAAG